MASLVHARLDAESIRDAMFGGRRQNVDNAIHGPPVEPNRVAEDAAKRLFSGPVDSNGRRSIYIKMTMMEPQRFLAQFNQPIPKLCTGKRDATKCPNQALALLKRSFCERDGKGLGRSPCSRWRDCAEHRAQEIFEAAFGRAPDDAEVDRVMKLAARCAELRGADTHAMMTCQPVWQDVPTRFLTRKNSSMSNNREDARRSVNPVSAGLRDARVVSAAISCAARTWPSANSPSQVLQAVGPPRSRKRSRRNSRRARSV